MLPFTPGAAFQTVALPGGTVRYRDVGAGPPIVFVHAALTNGAFWRNVVPPLAGDYRCLVPDLPLGGHAVPFPAEADLSPPGLARLVADFMTALDLRDVTLVGNDTGGAICQIVVANHPERLGRLVLTNCDAFENFLPPWIRPLQYAARVPGFAFALGRFLQTRIGRRAFLAPFAWTVPEPEILDSYFAPLGADPGVRRDLTKLLRGISHRQTLEAARAFPGFAKPVLLAWAPEDRFTFPIRYAHRLRDAFPNARLEEIRDSRTLVPEDQPERLAALIAAFVAEADGATPTPATPPRDAIGRAIGVGGPSAAGA